MPDDIAEAQALVEGVPSDRKVEFMGASYRLADKVGILPLLKFQRYAEANDARAMAAMYSILQDTIHPDEWQRFEDDAISKKADGDDLLRVVDAMVEILTARPTSPPGGSSPGRRQISGSSTAS